MKKPLRQKKTNHLTISNCNFSANGGDDSAARVELAKAIHINAQAALKLAENLGGAPILQITQEPQQ